jgi:hypothetical protein
MFARVLRRPRRFPILPAAPTARHDRVGLWRERPAEALPCPIAFAALWACISRVVSSPGCGSRPPALCIISDCVLGPAVSPCAKPRRGLVFYRFGFQRLRRTRRGSREDPWPGGNRPAGDLLKIREERVALARWRRCRVTAHDSADSRDAPPLRVAARAARRHSPMSQLVAVRA